MQMTHLLLRFALASGIVTGVAGCSGAATDDTHGTSDANGEPSTDAAPTGDTAPGSADPTEAPSSDTLVREDPTAAPSVSWYSDIAPIVIPNCSGCHQSGGIGPFALTNYEEVSALAPLVVDAVESRRMPPWGALETETCQPRFGWEHDLRLDDLEIALIREWYDADTPAGDVTELPAPSADDYTLPGATRELAPEGEFTTQGHGDQFRCFVLDPGYTEETWITGMHFLPGDPLVVHHALLYLDREGDSEALKDGAPDGGYDCFGGPDISAPELIAPWAPGAFPTALPEGVGVPIPAGARFVMQIHYHPIGAEPRTDLTRVQIRETSVKPEYNALSVLVGNADASDEQTGDGLILDGEDSEFVIPAGAKGHTERMRFTIPLTYQGKPSPGAFIYAVGTHMHYVGRDMEIRISRADRGPVCAAESVLPLAACIEGTACDQTEDELACIQTACDSEVNALSSECLGCLMAYGNNLDICLDAPDFSHYGPLQEDPADECLVQTPDWNFEWQRWYVYDQPDITRLPFLGPRDVLELRCTYDNSLDNPFVLRALQEQGLDAPSDVYLGDETLDEMCLAVMELIYKFPEE